METASSPILADFLYVIVMFPTDIFRYYFMSIIVVLGSSIFSILIIQNFFHDLQLFTIVLVDEWYQVCFS